MRRPDPKLALEKLRHRREALRKKAMRRLPKRHERKEGKEGRRRWVALAILLLLLLWLLMPDCSEEPEPEPLPAPTGPVQIEAEPAPEPPPTPAPALRRKERPAYDQNPPETLPWVASFRLQVAARSPRLAACFVGADRPGRLKWTAAVEPAHGVVSDHVLEPMFQSDALTVEQRECVLGVLSQPPYRLEADDERSTPSRVGMVIEF